MTLPESLARVARVTRMRILVVGSGGREHALARRLAADPRAPEVTVAPGNPGLATRFECLPISATDAAALADAAHTRRIDLVVIGPEAPLADGLADALRARGLVVFGPSREAARLESSKWFAKQILRDAQVATAAAELAESEAAALAALDGFGPPWVLKRDGLAAGKGVLVTADREAALAFARASFAGAAGAGRLLLEAFAPGEEASVMAVTDGERCVLLPAARDYKRAFDDDRGPNTGGMGAFAPHPAVSPRIAGQVAERVIAPVLRVMRERGTPFQGLLYAGLMLDGDTARVIEFNARFGDPETQVVLPLLEGSFVTLLESAARGQIEPAVAVRRAHTVAVALVAPGYPASSGGGGVLQGLDALDRIAGVHVIHAGTERHGDQWAVAGGRAAYVVAEASDATGARRLAYDAIAQLGGSGWRCRHDIGAPVGASHPDLRMAT